MVLINNIRLFTKRIKPPGFSGLSIYDVTIFFWKGIMNGSITTRAASLAFNFFLAFFPSIIVAFTLIPYIPIKDFQQTLMDLIEKILPPLTNTVTFTTIEDIINNPRGGLLSIRFLLALYFSTNGVNSLIVAFNASYHINESRSLIKQRVLSLMITMILSILVFISIILIIFNQSITHYIIEHGLIKVNIQNIILIGQWIIMITMLFFGISIVFYLAPAIKSKWKIISAGSIFSTVFIIMTSVLFSYYVDNFSQYNKIYGSIGTLIIILLWIYFNCITLLIGFELNVSILNAKKRIKI